MEEIKALLNLDFSTLIISIMTVMLGIKAFSSLIEWFSEKLGLETKWQREKRLDHELLIKTSESLNALQNRHQEDVEQSIAHDKAIKEELSNFMMDMKKSVSDTQSELLNYSQNRLKDREQSLKIQKELIDYQTKLADSQKDMSISMDVILNTINEMKRNNDIRFESNEKRFIENEEKQNTRLRAELKDKIGQSYRFYHEKGQINDMEFEALEDLIKAYESADGKNSFVHDIVQKDMYSWQRIN